MQFSRARRFWIGGLSAVVCGAFIFASYAAATKLGRLAPMPDFDGITQWLNTSKPITKEDLKGKVVLVDFWTYSCINCVRSIPHLLVWYKKYHAQGFEIIGVHTPEFHFEKDPSNVMAAIKKFNLPYPVAMDNEYKTWDKYGSRSWPSDYLIGRFGYVRFQHFGEADYDGIEEKISSLLAEENPSFVSPKTTPLGGADFKKIKTPEIYLGVYRLSHIGNSESILLGQKQTFKQPKALRRNQFYLVGDWRFHKEYVELASAEGKVLIRFEANAANMVLQSAGEKEILAEVLIDGRPATAQNKGSDVYLESGRALCKIRDSGVYNFAIAGYGDHTLELHFLGSGLQAYTFTFG